MLDPSSLRMKSRTLRLVETVGLAVVYFGCGRFGLSLAFVHPSATAVWPPTGVALAALLLRGRHLWPGVLLGAFLANYFTAASVPTALGIAAGNTLEALVAAWLVNRYANGALAFERTTTIFNFISCAALGSTLVSATCGVTFLCLGGLAGWSQAGPIWLTWWLGDMVSDILVAPLLLVWLAGAPPRLNLSQAAQALCLILVIAWVGDFVFMGHNPFSAKHLPLEFLAIPPLVFAAFQFGQHGALTSAFILSGLALWGTRKGHGPFSRPEPNESLILVQAFMGTITLTSMVLASIVSERRRTEQALHQAREDLRKHAADLELRVQQRTASLQDTFHSLESLCYSIAHDLRAPLRAIAGYTDILGEDYEKLVDERGKEYLWRVKAAAARMDLLILDLLQLGRVGSAEIAPADLQLEPIAQRVLAQMHEEIKSRNAEIHLNKPLLPVFANGALLEQILHNLFANALKFARNETKPRIELWTESRENWVRICVKDNGIGIESEHLERIFQPFEKLTSHPAAQGNGIGLAIVRKGVERMGGRVGVESCPGAGSCFWLELPRPGLTATWTI